MKLRTKIMLIMSLTTLALIIILYGFAQVAMVRTAVKIEEDDTRQNVRRALNAFSDELEKMLSMTRDYASWDDTYAFMIDRNEKYVKTNLVDETFLNLRLNLMLFVNTDGQIVFQRGFDLRKGCETQIPPSMLEHINPNSPLLHHSNERNAVAGILILPEGPLIVTSAPILTSRYTGPIRGTLIMGRYLNSDEVSRLSQTTHLLINIFQVDDSKLPSDFQTATTFLLTNRSEIFIKPLNEKSIAGYSLINDIYGEPALILRVDLPRNVYNEAKQNTAYFIYSMLLSASAYAVAIILLVERSITSRVIRLERMVDEIGRTKNVAVRIPVTGKDEISSLTENVNSMLEQLEEHQRQIRHYLEHLEELVEERTKKLLEYEKLATIGEVAMMVGHDLRNPLQVMMNIVYLAGEYLKSILPNVPDHDKAEQIRELCSSMEEQIEYMNKIVSDLQDFGRPLQPQFQPTNLMRLIENTVSNIRKPETVKISLNFKDEFPNLKIDGVMIQRALTNLITNAIQAMPKGGRITIMTLRRGDIALINVQDTGEGIPEEKLDKLFKPFFTTKAKGQGLGLTVTKRIVEAHGGAIKVESKVGVGTTFTIELPLKEG
ncbi:HAMP domain-containing protein [Candidatus Bathyarchaeota archaeon]|nr:HAMP domain-containing protein [Candidatus Bathyarchaeota archaeon]